MDETSSDWGSWIQQTFGTVITAAVNKEFAPDGMVSYQTYQVDQYGRPVASGSPSYQQAPAIQNQQQNTTLMMLIGGALLLYMLSRG